MQVQSAQQQLPDGAAEPGPSHTLRPIAAYPDPPLPPDLSAQQLLTSLGTPQDITVMPHKVPPQPPPRPPPARPAVASAQLNNNNNSAALAALVAAGRDFFAAGPPYNWSTAAALSAALTAAGAPPLLKPLAQGLAALSTSSSAVTPVPISLNAAGPPSLARPFSLGAPPGPSLPMPTTFRPALPALGSFPGALQWPVGLGVPTSVPAPVLPLPSQSLANVMATAPAASSSMPPPPPPFSAPPPPLFWAPPPVFASSSSMIAANSAAAVASTPAAAVAVPSVVPVVGSQPAAAPPTVAGLEPTAALPSGADVGPSAALPAVARSGPTAASPTVAGVRPASLNGADVAPAAFAAMVPLAALGVHAAASPPSLAGDATAPAASSDTVSPLSDSDAQRPTKRLRRSGRIAQVEMSKQSKPAGASGSTVAAKAAASPTAPTTTADSTSAASAGIPVVAPVSSHPPTDTASGAAVDDASAGAKNTGAANADVANARAANTAVADADVAMAGAATALPEASPPASVSPTAEASPPLPQPPSAAGTAALEARTGTTVAAAGQEASASQQAGHERAAAAGQLADATANSAAPDVQVINLTQQRADGSAASSSLQGGPASQPGLNFHLLQQKLQHHLQQQQQQQQRVGCGGGGAVTVSGVHCGPVPTEVLQAIAQQAHVEQLPPHWPADEQPTLEQLHAALSSQRQKQDLIVSALHTLHRAALDKLHVQLAQKQGEQRIAELRAAAMQAKLTAAEAKAAAATAELDGTQLQLRILRKQHELVLHADPDKADRTEEDADRQRLVRNEIARQQAEHSKVETATRQKHSQAMAKLREELSRRHTEYSQAVAKLTAQHDGAMARRDKELREVREELAWQKAAHAQAIVEQHRARREGAQSSGPQNDAARLPPVCNNTGAAAAADVQAQPVESHVQTTVRRESGTCVAAVPPTTQQNGGTTSSNQRDAEVSKLRGSLALRERQLCELRDALLLQQALMARATQESQEHHDKELAELRDGLARATAEAQKYEQLHTGALQRLRQTSTEGLDELKGQQRMAIARLEADHSVALAAFSDRLLTVHAAKEELNRQLVAARSVVQDLKAQLGMPSGAVMGGAHADVSTKQTAADKRKHVKATAQPQQNGQRPAVLSEVLAGEAVVVPRTRQWAPPLPRQAPPAAAPLPPPGHAPMAAVPPPPPRQTPQAAAPLLQPRQAPLPKQPPPAAAPLLSQRQVPPTAAPQVSPRPPPPPRQPPLTAAPLLPPRQAPSAAAPHAARAGPHPSSHLHTMDLATPNIQSRDMPDVIVIDSPPPSLVETATSAAPDEGVSSQAADDQAFMAAEEAAVRAQLHAEHQRFLWHLRPPAAVRREADAVAVQLAREQAILAREQQAEELQLAQQQQVVPAHEQEADGRQLPQRQHQVVPAQEQEADGRRLAQGQQQAVPARERQAEGGRSRALPSGQHTVRSGRPLSSSHAPAQGHGLPHPMRNPAGSSQAATRAHGVRQRDPAGGYAEGAQIPPTAPGHQQDSQQLQATIHQLRRSLPTADRLEAAKVPRLATQ